MATILDLPEVRERVFHWSVAEYEKLEDDPAFRRTELIRGMIVNKVPVSSAVPDRKNTVRRGGCGGVLDRARFGGKG